MRTVLIATKNYALKEKLQVDLATLGYQVVSSSAETPDVIVTDYPELEAVERSGFNKPVLVFFERVEDIKRDVLYRADDVLLNPYVTSDLELRLKLALLRHGDYEAVENVMDIDGMVINFDSYEVMIDGLPLDLTFKEYELLKCLATGKGRVYTRDQLLSTVWGYDYYGGARTVDVHIRRLRAKLGRHESLIETVRNVGYRFKKHGL